MAKISGIQHQKVIVIGGTSGFGLAVAHLAVEAGAMVTIVGQNAERLKAALQTFEPQDAITGQAFDASKMNLLQGFFAKQGHFDHLISTLGGAMAGGFIASSIAQIRKTIEDKFFTNLQLIQVAQPWINDGGTITLTSGTGGSPATASGAIVGNQAINTMVKGLAIELAPTIRVNAVAPTWTPTGLWRDLSSQARQQQLINNAKTTPLQRVATVDEVAQGYLSLITNHFITGEVLAVDGGVGAESSG